MKRWIVAFEKQEMLPNTYENRTAFKLGYEFCENDMIKYLLECCKDFVNKEVNCNNRSPSDITSPNDTISCDDKSAENEK